MLSLVSALTWVNFTIVVLDQRNPQDPKIHMSDPSRGASIRLLSEKLRNPALRDAALDELAANEEADIPKDVRRSLTTALIRVLVAVEADPDADGYCEQISKLLIRIGKPTLEDLIGFTTHACSLVRQCSIRTLAKQKARSRPVIVAIVSMLADRRPVVRAEACKALQLVHQHLTLDDINKLIRRLRDASPRVIEAAVVALGECGNRADQAVPELMRLLDRTDRHSSRIGFVALLSLSNMSVKDRKYIPKLVRLLQRNWAKLDIEAPGNLWIFMGLGPAVSILGAYGPAAKEAIPALEKLLRVKVEGIGGLKHVSVSHALLKIDPKNLRAVSMLKMLSRSKEDRIRSEVVDCLADSSIDVRLKMREVLDVLATDRNQTVKRNAVSVLKTLKGRE